MNQSDLDGLQVDRLSSARERFARDWQDLRDSVGLEAGLKPQWPRNAIWPVLALTAGMALGAGIWWRRRKTD